MRSLKTLFMTLKIEFNDLNIRTRQYRSEIKKLIDTIIDSNYCLNGPENKKLEKNLLHFFKCGLVSIVGSGHDALLLSLQSLKLKNTDEVIFPDNSYPTVFPIAQVFAKAVPCDVNENGLIDPKKIAKKITKNTRAIIITHLYGLVCDVDEIKKVIKGQNIFLIEDCAQAFGSTYKDRPVGTLGNIGCFSFYPTKNLGTLGDGGAIWTNNEALYDYFLKWKSYGEIKKYSSEFIAGHSRMPEIQAGILNIYFKNIKQDFDKKIKIAQYYQEKIKKSGFNKYVRVLKSSINSYPLQHLFVVEVKNRDKIQKYLQKHNIETYIHFPTPIHLQPAFSFLNKKIGDFLQAEKLSKNILSLPFHQYLKKNQINHIIKLIKRFYA